MSGHADTIREKAETLAGLMSIGSLTADESEIGVNTIFDLLAENQRYEKALERIAGWNDPFAARFARETLAGDAE